METTTLDSAPLIQGLLNYTALDRKRFHVPGHSGRAVVGKIPGFTEALYEFDQTEVEGLDVLSVPEPAGCLNLAQQQAAATFGVWQSFYLVNGASVGIQAAMLACLKPGDKVLLPRNCHRSVISGLILTGAQPVWFLPDYLADWGLWTGVTLAQIRAQDLTDIRALVFPSATYEGLAAETEAIAQFCKSKNILTIADEAHGSLWPFSDHLPKSACQTACDVVIQSLHKSAGSLTQTALAHLPHGSRLCSDRFQQALNTLQTTSPSYLLMSSLDATQSFLNSRAGQRHIQDHIDRVLVWRKRFAELIHFELFTPEVAFGASFEVGFDPSRLWFRHQTEAGLAWGPRLEAERQIAYEATNPCGVLYVCGLGLTEDDYQALWDAFLTEEQRLKTAKNRSHLNLAPAEMPALPQGVYTPREAFFMPGRIVSSAEAIGHVAQETLVHCPPGIPILMPGERITDAHQAQLPEKIRVII